MASAALVGMIPVEAELAATEFMIERPYGAAEAETFGVIDKGSV